MALSKGQIAHSWQSDRDFRMRKEECVNEKGRNDVRRKV